MSERKRIDSAFVLGMVAVIAIVAFLLTKPDPLASSGNGYGYSFVNSGVIDTTNWIDLSTYGYPDKIFLQVDLMAASLIAPAVDCTLMIWIEGSNNTNSYDRNGYKCRLLRLYDNGNYSDSVFLSADAGTANYYTFPIVGVVDMTTGADTIYQKIPPVTALPRYIRIWSQASKSATGAKSSTWTKRFTIQYPQ